MGRDFPFGVLGKTVGKDINWAEFARVELAGLGWVETFLATRTKPCNRKLWFLNEEQEGVWFD